MMTHTSDISNSHSSWIISRT